ncbi:MULTISPECIES: replicative helicase loader/inhibitor [Paenibacillus]|uniref:replicative helicase loader/inhibitor n=1 Tax=Paenibacillus TaxID=44249 RepID=UPI0022B86E9B|nr:replicative helicase loader/inhibitor [Paenibacillus caseinilyticus]MCZ8520156.1 replicative helicase loader/inhibitor [Paenibacillus caseinilyticus]
MTLGEIAKLFKRIRRHYPQFEVMDEGILLEWQRLLAEASSEEVHSNLDVHIQNSEWPPKIAHLLGKTSETSIYYDTLREGTLKRFDEIDEWQKKAAPPPAELKERMRQLAASRTH